MRKREFLRELSRRLDNMDKKEKDDVIEYYDELIEDTIERTGKSEEDVIYDLGSISEISKRVNPNKYSKYEEPSESERIHYDEYTEEDVKHDHTDYSRVNENKFTKKEHRTKTVVKHSTIGIILIIVTFPIWFAIMMSIIGVIIGIAAAGIGIVVGGVASLVGGILSFAGSLPQGLFLTGLGLLLIGLAFILIPLIIKLLAFIVKLIGKGINALATKRRVYYEN